MCEHWPFTHDQPLHDVQREGKQLGKQLARKARCLMPHKLLSVMHWYS